MEKNKVQNDKVQPDGEISNEDLEKVAGGAALPRHRAECFSNGLGCQCGIQVKAAAVGAAK